MSENEPTTARPAPAFTEAPVSFNVKAISSTGYECQLTLRDNDAGDLMPRALKALDWLAQHGFTPHGYKLPTGNGNGQPPAPPAAQPGAPPVAKSASGGAQPAGNATFAAGSLVATVSEGKTYWKVRGGKYSKHGVTIWPEALADAGFDAAVLDPMTTYDLGGYTATVEMENDKPRKITKLEKATY